MVHHRLGNFDTAERCLDRALALAPNQPELHWDRAMLLLLQGKLREGWVEFEWRLKARPELRRDFPEPTWQGEDIAGRTILLYTEGGFGDAIHFIRYAPMVAQRGATVLVECQAELASLLSRIEGVAKVIPRGQSLPRFDVRCPLQSLPRFMGTDDLSMIPSHVPYLGVAPERRAKWQALLGPRDGAKLVGLCWAGSGDDPNASRRTRSLDLFRPLAKISGVRFVSLQKGPEAVQAINAGADFPIVTLDAQMLDFDDAAALVEQLDLVISVDTSIAHLAGALAKPVWVLISQMPDFRWLYERRDSPWYPTMRLYRRGNGERWPAVVTRLVDDLQLWVNDRRSNSS
jgi:hypothetical protein